VPPVVADVEHVAELVARLQLPRDLQRLVVKPAVLARIDVRKTDAPPVSKLEDVQVG
jgi:hypothetical protein